MKIQAVVVLAAVFILLATLVAEGDGLTGPISAKKEMKDKVWTSQL